MKKIDAMVMSATDGMPDIDFIEVELCDSTIINILRGVNLLKANPWIDCLDIKNGNTKIVKAVDCGDPVDVRLETFTVTVEESGAVMIRAWSKTDPEEIINAEFTLD